MVSPDEGGVKRAVSLANDLGLDFAMIHNRIKVIESEEILIGTCLFFITLEDVMVVLTHQVVLVN